MQITKGQMSALVQCEDQLEEYYTSIVVHALLADDKNVYAAEIKRTERTDDRARYRVRIHINFIHDFVKALDREGVRTKEITWLESPLPVPDRRVFKVKPQWTTRDYQAPAIESLANLEQTIGLLLMGTGRGKTYCLLRAVSMLGYRFILMARPKYMDKWVSDIQEIYDIDPDRIVTVRGSKDMDAIIANKGGIMDTSDCLVLSNATYSAYVRRHLTDRDKSGVRPEDLMQHLGVGVVCFDEADEHFHSHLMMTLYAHVIKALFVTATMRPRDLFMKKIFKMAFTREQTYYEKRSSKHITMVPVMFSFRNLKRIRSKGFKGMYSHGAVEKSIMADYGTLERYTKMVIAVVHDWTIKRAPNTKLIVYAYTKQLCTHFTTKLAKVFAPLTVKRFVAGDPYENIIDPDIRVTTISSGGRAMDIPGLSGVFLTISIDSEAANDQVSGRLRESSSDQTKLFYYIYTKQLPVHVKYHKNRAKTLVSKLKATNEVVYPNAI